MAMKALKTMKATKAAAPPKTTRVDKAGVAKFLKKAMKATKAKKRDRKVEVWSWCDTRNIPNVWVVSHWNGQQIEHEVYGQLTMKHTMHVD